MNKATTVCVIMMAFIFLLFSPKDGRASDDSIKAETGINLPAKIRRVLAAEMNAVQRGITSLAIAIPAGKWKDIVETGRGMKKGYVLKKKLSAGEYRKFQQSLPEGYRALDSEFNIITGRMVRAAEKYDMDLVTREFRTLIGNCVRCHSRYAEDRFPGLGTDR